MDDIYIYQYDGNRVFTTAFKVEDIYGPVPAGTTVAPPELKKGEFAQWDGVKWNKLSKYPEPSVPTPPSSIVNAAQVDEERDRRLEQGFTFRGKLIQSRAGDRENILGMSQLAFQAVVGGAEEGNLRWANADRDFQWIAADNSLVPMDAQTVVELGRAAAAFKDNLVFKARALKDTSPIPADYMDSKYW